MKLNIAKEVAALEQMTVGQLQQRYVEVFAEPVRSRHKQYLIRRIAWRLQANAEGAFRIEHLGVRKNSLHSRRHAALPRGIGQTRTPAGGCGWRFSNPAHCLSAKAKGWGAHG